MVVVRTMSTLGYNHSEETLQKIRESKQGKPMKRYYTNTCLCGREFSTARATTKYCPDGCGPKLLQPAFQKFDTSQCGICESVNGLVGDHHHGSNTPRGVLCERCNLGLGQFFDDPDLMMRAIEYLTSSGLFNTKARAR